MADATGRPQRMRYSFEARCRAVALMRAGVSPRAAAATVGASRATGFRWRARYQADARGPSTPKRRRLSAADEARSRAQWGRPVHARCAARSARLDHRQGAAAAGAFAAHDSRGRRSYERARPGDLLHLDTKKLGRFWHVGKRIHRDGSSAARGPAGSTWPSTTIRGWPTPRCGPATARPTPWLSSSVPWPGTTRRASGFGKS